STSELPLVHLPAKRRAHACALVDTEGAGVALGIDAEADAGVAAIPQAPERVLEDRAADAAPAPRAAREEPVDPPAAVERRDVDRPRDDVVAGADDVPERRVEPVVLEVVRAPLLERTRAGLPVVGERLLVRGVERARVAGGIELVEAEAVRQHGRGGLLLQ